MAIFGWLPQCLTGRGRGLARERAVEIIRGDVRITDDAVTCREKALCTKGTRPVPKAACNEEVDPVPTLGPIVWIGSQGTLHKGEWCGQQVAVRVLRRKVCLPPGAIAAALLGATCLQHDNLMRCLHIQGRAAAPEPGRLSIHDSAMSAAGFSPADASNDPPPPSQAVLDLEPHKPASPPSHPTFPQTPPDAISHIRTVRPSTPTMAARLTGTPNSASAPNTPAPPAPMELWTVLEYCNGGTLAQAMARRWQYLPDGFTLHLGRVLSCLVGVARALRYLHRLDQFHGELSSTTVLLHTPKGCSEAVPKLTALPTERMLPPQLGYEGSSSRWEASLVLPGSSIGYCCPEMLTGRGASPACDVYALGMLMWEMVSDARPFSGLKPGQVVQHVVEGGGRPMFPSHLPPCFVDLACSCWVQDPACRPTAAQVVQQLEGMAHQAALLQGEMEQSLGELRNMLAIIC